MHVRLRARLGAVASAAALALTAGPAAAAELPSGPDVSHWQHPAGAPIDWAAVRSGGQSFAFLKATEGATWTDPNFATDWADVRTAGLYRGAYHFARPDATAGDALAEAGHFASVVGATDQPGDLPPVLDIETDGGLDTAALVTWTQTFLTAVEAATGRKPIVYTYPNFWAAKMGGSAAFAGYPLWIAHYGVEAPTITPWTDWTFWQQTKAGTVPGISTVGGTDVNRFNGSASELARLALVPALPALSLSGPKAAVPYGSTATVSGTLRRADGSAVAGAQVQLWTRRTGQAAKLLATVRTAADGGYRYTFKPTATVTVTARSLATPVDLAAESPASTVRVAAVVAAHWSDRTVTRGTLVQLRGTVLPHLAGTLITRQVWDRTRWKAVATARAGSDGAFTFPVRARATTPRAHRVVATPTGYSAGSLVLPKLRIS